MYLTNSHSPSAAQYTRWNKLGFSKEAFHKYPDLVDFVFKSHLHRHIRHPSYNHTIEMRPVFSSKLGRVTIENEPHLLLDGRFVPWSKIRERIKVDAGGNLYSIENGEKKDWNYLANGLTIWNKNHFDHPQYLRKLDRPPTRSRVEVVTSHAHKSDWNLGDRFLKGTRHSFFRLVPGEGFAARYPNAKLEDGGVYSFGWIPAQSRDFGFFTPLATLRGRWTCPDWFEFQKQDLCVTPYDVSDAKMAHLMELIRQKSRQPCPFHIITANCCGATADLLKNVGIVNLNTKDHMAGMWYKFFLPKSVRRPIDKIMEFLNWMTPGIVLKGVSHLASFAYSVVFVPIFSALGAWRVSLSFEEEENDSPFRARAENRIKALFSNIFDLFNPSKMEFDLTKNIYKWQKKMPQSYFERKS